LPQLVNRHTSGGGQAAAYLLPSLPCQARLRYLAGLSGPPVRPGVIRIGQCCDGTGEQVASIGADRAAPASRAHGTPSKVRCGVKAQVSPLGQIRIAVTGEFDSHWPAAWTVKMLSPPLLDDAPTAMLTPNTVLVLLAVYAGMMIMPDDRAVPTYPRSEEHTSEL